MAQSEPSRLGWRFQNASKGEPVQVVLFGVVGDPWDGVTGGDFVNEWRAETKGNPPVTLTINSVGGYIDDALGIYNEILQYPGTTTANIIVARSAASFIAMATDHRTIAKTGEFQIHDAIIPFFDLINSNRLEELYAALKPRLESESLNIAGIYADRAGGTVADWRAAMQANGLQGTNYRGQEAVDAGLVHEVMPVRNQERTQRIAAMAVAGPIETPVDPTVEIDLSLIPPMANGYKPPLPTDFTHLIAAQPKGA